MRLDKSEGHEASADKHESKYCKYHEGHVRLPLTSMRVNIASTMRVFLLLILIDKSEGHEASTDKHEGKYCDYHEGISTYPS